MTQALSKLMSRKKSGSSHWVEPAKQWEAQDKKRRELQTEAMEEGQALAEEINKRRATGSTV